jgi:hypothetical protein
MVRDKRARKLIRRCDALHEARARADARKRKREQIKETWNKVKSELAKERTT